jgi:hypothetical protein
MEQKLFFVTCLAKQPGRPKAYFLLPYLFRFPLLFIATFVFTPLHNRATPVHHEGHARALASAATHAPVAAEHAVVRLTHTHTPRTTNHLWEQVWSFVLSGLAQNNPMR